MWPSDSACTVDVCIRISMTSVPCNPFSWSAVDRAHRLGLCTLFVREELALPVPLDAVGVYLQFNIPNVPSF